MENDRKSHLAGANVLYFFCVQDFGVNLQSAYCLTGGDGSVYIGCNEFGICFERQSAWNCCLDGSANVVHNCNSGPTIFQLKFDMWSYGQLVGNREA